MSSELRWRLAGTDGQGTLFPDGEVDPTRELPNVEYLHVRAQKIISKVPNAARLPFEFTINPYRGCTHACTYCFARPTHEYLGLNAGEDFERRIVVKINAVERLRAELRDPRWGHEHIAMGTNTDPYQPVEGRYKLTRGIVEALGEARNPFSILTKSTMLLRDLDLLVEAAKDTDVAASYSIGTLDEEVWRIAEPGTPPPRRRLEAVARINDAGIPCGVLIAPILPGLSDSEEHLDAIVRGCIEAGATSVAPILLHLRPGVREQYMPWLADVRPDLVARYEELYRNRSGYAPKAEREKVSETVRRLVRRYGGVSVRARDTRMTSSGHELALRSRRPPAPPAPEPEQLGLPAA